MAQPSVLGEFEQIVLLGLLQCGGEAYAVPICREIHTRTGREVSLGAVYKTLDRLEGKHLVRSTLGAATAERGGRAKRIYTTTPAGLRALRSSLIGLAKMRDGLDALLGTS